MDEMGQVADVIGVRMGDEDGLDAGLLREGELRGESAGVNREPVVDQVPGQIMFCIRRPIGAEHLQPHLPSFTTSAFALGTPAIVTVRHRVVQQRDRSHLLHKLTLGNGVES
jgi:hypothetical protein